MNNIKFQKEKLQMKIQNGKKYNHYFHINMIYFSSIGYNHNFDYNNFNQMKLNNLNNHNNLNHNVFESSFR